MSRKKTQGPALLNALFHEYGHAAGYLYDFPELAAAIREALGDECRIERSAFRESAALPEVAAALDDPTKAHESLYVDIVCGGAGGGEL